MAISREAIKYTSTLLRQGRLRLSELCRVMAVYGARTLDEERAEQGVPTSELVDGIVAAVLAGDYPSGPGVPAALRPGITTDELAASASWQDVDEVSELGSDLDDVGLLGTDVDGLQDDSTDLGGPPATQLHRRTVRADDVPGARRAATLTKLARFYADSGFEPTVSPGLDADGPTLDADGTTQYAIGGPIGQGGAGFVLHGVDRDLRRSVAIKALHDKHRNNPLLLRAFIEEAIITGGLEHPNIVPVYQLGLHDDLGPYYVMKRLDGVTLGVALQGLRRHDPEMEARFDLDRLLAIFIEVCQALVYAHDRRVIHCDIKPNNILIGHYGEVVLVDWGLAFVMGDAGTLQARSQFWSGTPGFMAPEQVIGDVTAYDPRTDIWALGGLLYAMLCLARPFVGKSKQETLHQVLNCDPVPPSRKNPTRRVPESLERICLKALSKRKEDRYGTVSELMAEVENHLAGRRRLRQRVELGQKALAEARTHLDSLSGTEAVVDALQTKLVQPGVSQSKQSQWRADLQELREPLALAYREAIRVAIEAVEAGAHHPALNAIVGDLYWRVFRRLYPARVPANRQIQRLATEMLHQVGEVALIAVVQQGRKLAGLSEDALPLADAGDPWLEAVLAYCGPEATAPDADREGVAAELGRRLAFLKDVELFRDVPGMELLPIAAACEHRVYRARTAIFNQGDFGDSLYILIDGVVNVFVDQTIVSALGPAAVLGEIAIIDGAHRTATASCATDVSVYRLSAEQFRAIVRDNGSIGLAVMRVLTNRLRRATHREGALRSLQRDSEA